MPDIKGTALLPKGEANGFVAIAKELHDEPLKLRAALVVFNAKRGTDDYDSDDTVITVRVLRVARLLPQDLAHAEAMLRRSVEYDSGQTTLELDLEDEIRRAFDSMKEPDSPVDPDEPGKGKGEK
jgi:hypothetical protein